MEPRQTDVLVVGAGPAGLFTSLFLARAGVSDITIIDREAFPVQIGHASGIHPRTLEILHTLNIHSELLSGSGGVAETAFWTSSGEDGGLKRSSVAPEGTHETFYRRTVVQHQGKMEAVLNAELRKRNKSICRPLSFLDYHYLDEDGSPYRVCAFLKNHMNGNVEVWHCKYLVAADGGHSLVRQLSGIGNTVNESEATWAVGDFACETDFPDLRRRCPIRTSRGNLMLIPSPNKTLRIYMLLAQDDLQELDKSRFYKTQGTTKGCCGGENRTTLLDLFQRKLLCILKPYTINIKNVLWISRYTVAQRVTDRFYDGKNVIFVGDSCHTNSPKAGQGMNTGIHDAHNLGWKLALILRGRAHPSLLETYNLERRHIALQLIDFDKRFATMFADQSDIARPEFRQTWAEHRGFASGLSHHYPSSSVVHDVFEGGDANTKEAPGSLIPGRRFLPMRLIRHIDGWEVTSLDVMPCNGEFHLVIFAGDIAAEPGRSAFEHLYKVLTGPCSTMRRYNGRPEQARPDDSSIGPESKTWLWEDIHTNSQHSAVSNKIVNLFVVHTSSHFGIELRPQYDEWMYKFFEDRGGVEHERHGIDGLMMALVRPDGIVRKVFSSLDKLDVELREYFEQAGIEP